MKSPARARKPLRVTTSDLNLQSDDRLPFTKGRSERRLHYGAMRVDPRNREALRGGLDGADDEVARSARHKRARSLHALGAIEWSADATRFAVSRRGIEPNRARNFAAPRWARRGLVHGGGEP